MKGMKRFYTPLFAVILTLFTAACSESPEPEIIPPQGLGRTTLEVSSESPLLVMQESGLEGEVGFKTRGGELALDVVTNQEAWAYETRDAEWLEVEADDYFLYLKADENTGDASRTASVEIWAGEGERCVTVLLEITQNHAGMPEISLVTNELHFEAHTGLEQEVAVETNQEEWTFTCTCPWLLIEKEGQTLRLTADDNARTAQRETTITVITSRGEEQDRDQLRVRQDGDAFVVLSTQSVATDDQGGVKQIRVESNPELTWTFTIEEADWFKATSDQKNLYIEVNSNEGGVQRTGYLTIVVGDENNSATVRVRVLQIGSDTEELIYEIEVPEKDYSVTAAPVLTVSTGGSIQVDWGDGSPIDSFESRRGTHTYQEPGLYTITITGEAKSLRFGKDDSVTTELRNVLSWGKMGYTTAADMCLGCVSLESIPNDVAGSFASVKSFLGAFSCCESLREIPSGLFRYATVARTFEDCFSHSASIREIPAGLFDNCETAEDFSYAFYATGTGVVSTSSTLPNFDSVKALVDKGGLKSLPNGLFAHCPKAKQFDYTFGATAIESIPEDLFSASNQATLFTGAFSACTRLQQIPVGLMRGAVAATDIKYMFAGCCSVKNLPVGMFTENAAVTNLEYIFYKTGVESLQVGIFEGMPLVKTVGAVFQDCQSLTEVPGNLFQGLTGAKSFRYCFADCTALRSIPADLFAGMSNAYEFTYTFHNTALESVPVNLFQGVRDYSSADFTYMFSECMNLKTLPTGLFDTFTKVTSPGFKNLFTESGIETIPEGLFARCTAVSSGFESLFENCPELREIQGSIFPETTSVSSIAYLFCNCPKLESIPADLFKPFGTAKLKFTAVFANCQALKEIPEGLFAANSRATQFSETFCDCVSLQSIPADLLASCPDITTVKGLFQGCVLLEEIPETLFANNPAITSFEKTFAECTSLKSIPADLFSAIGTKTSSIKFSSCFAQCSSLETVPVSLFDTVRRINYIDSCFEGCVSLTGESPYTTLVAEDGSEKRVHLYERERGDDFPNAPVTESAHEDCFAGCELLTDYNNMPTTWR